MNKRSCNSSVVRAEPPEDLGAVHPREKGTNMKLWDGMASSSHRRWLVWLITGKHGWNMRFWIESGSVPSEKMEKFEGRGGQWWDLTQNLENSLWQLLEHLFGARREWGRLLRGLLQRSGGSWWLGLGFGGEMLRNIYMMPSCVSIVMHDGYVLYLYSVDLTAS